MWSSIVILALIALELVDVPNDTYLIHMIRPFIGCTFSFGYVGNIPP
jgi:hypothetical protein